MEEKLYGNPEKPYGFELVADTLVKQGVDTVFSLTGNSVISLLTELNHRGIKVVGCRSEQGAVLAASGYSVSTGKTGVAVLTAGYMGVAFYGMLNASFGNIPVVVIAGCNVTYATGLRSQQELDQIPAAKAAYAKETYHITNGERIPQMLTWAFSKANSNVPGCVFVDIAQDVIKGHVDVEEMKRYVPCKKSVATLADPTEVKKAAELLKSAKTPCIVVGRLGYAADIHDELKELVDMTGIPVETCAGALGPHPLNIGMSGCASDADVALLIGKQSIGLLPENSAEMHTGKIISIYPDTSDFGHAYPVEVGLPGDIKLVMRQLVDELKGAEFPDYSEWVSMLRSKQEMFGMMTGIPVEDHESDVPINPAVAGSKIVDFMFRKKLDEDSIIAMDGADCMQFVTIPWMAKGMIQHFPGQLLSILNIENGTAMGVGLPMAVGAAAANPGKFLFIPAMGDGAIGYHLAELETLARLNTPALIVIGNNSFWGLVYQDQRRIYSRKERTGADLGVDLHYEKVAEGLGGLPGYYVDKPEDIEPALEKAYEDAVREKKPVIVNIITNPFIYGMEYANWTLPATEEGEPYNGFGE